MSSDQQRPAQPEAYGVHIDAGPGHADIRLNGEVLPREQVAGYTLHHHSVAEALPTLILNTRQPDGIVWQGLARVAVGVQQDPGEVIAAFLDSVDPDVLDRAALNRTDLGSGKGAVARAMLTTLAEWAQGGEG
ncbi:hypothetical protein [Streptomyces olivaceiscleroticus]|uniref:Uncharacterized protein n=1 Tax=Streptomyces olivaceiscleroticus TaxID=68245 RepID=A0ABN1BPK6_9ACTN